ncbi:hypothetical protein ACF1E9_32005 [Streptomyces roseolus]|uniref:hypothetical protein n=1 Tax=Streptomyces TaxID=1883 RepID=UPI0036EBA6FF
MSGKAQVFTEKDYGGARADLDVGHYNLGSGTGSVGEDTISSLKISPGYRITVYKDRDCAGASWTFTTDTPSLDYLDDAVSSVSVEERPSGFPDSVVFVAPPPVS